MVKANIIFLATNAAGPVVFKSHLEHAGMKTVIDLCKPCNVDAEVKNMEAVELVFVDQVSKLRDDNLQKRAAEVPKARKIIELQMCEFIEWYERRQRRSALSSFEGRSNAMAATC